MSLAHIIACDIVTNVKQQEWWFGGLERDFQESLTLSSQFTTTILEKQDRHGLKRGAFKLLRTS